MRRIWEDKFKPLLGNMPDVAVAQIANIPEYIVLRWRRFYGIKSYRKQNLVKDNIKKMSDEMLLKTPLCKFRAGERAGLADELRRRGLRRHKERRIVFRVGEDNLKTVMVKAAFKMNPPPTL